MKIIKGKADYHYNTPLELRPLVKFKFANFKPVYYENAKTKTLKRL